MRIDRNELIQEITLRKHIQKIIRNASGHLIREKYNKSLQEQKLRHVIRKLVPSLLKEEASNGNTKQEVAISLVRDTLLNTIKIIKSDQSKFKDPGVQDGFRKYCMLALHNDFEENHGEEGESEIEYEEPLESETKITEPPKEDLEEPAEEPEDDLVLEFANDGDDKIEYKIKPSEDPMFIPDEEEKEETSEEDEKTDFESQEEELFLTLTDAEKVGFRYAKETTWSKVTKQIKRIHKKI